MAKRKYLTREEAAAKDWYSETELRRLRLKPRADQWPVGVYWQGHGTVAVYERQGCIKMRPYRPATPAQLAALAAGRELLGTSVCTACGQRVERDDINRRGICSTCVAEQSWQGVISAAAHWLAEEPVFLDTETTGLDNDAEICEIAILDAAGAVLFASLVKPSCSMPAGAQRIHGITDDDLSSAPTWSAISGQASEVLAGRLIVAHNASFDRRMLQQTCVRHGVAEPAPLDWQCTMDLLTPANGGRWPNLGVAADLAGADPRGIRHRAAGDAELVRRIVCALAAQAQA